MDPEIAYYERRFSEELAAAHRAESDTAERAHRELAFRYSERLRSLHGGHSTTTSLKAA